MTKHRTFLGFLHRLLPIVAASNSLIIAACEGSQDFEIPGPLTVTRMTLNDPGGNNATGTSVFTDTSSPQDCTLPGLQDSAACISTPFTDMFSPKKSPPNPDSATKLRVVFNKLPLKLNGQDIEVPPEGGLPMGLSDFKLIAQGVIQLQCMGSGCGVPESYNSMWATGSALSPDPTFFDYGPALQMEVLPAYDPALGTTIAADPLRALEPGTVYKVVLNPGLSGRNPSEKVLSDSASDALLTFTTERFQVIRIGIGAGNDALTGGGCLKGSGTASDPYIATAALGGDGVCSYTDLANDGVMAIQLNAGVDHTVLRATTATATVSVNNGPAMPVTVVVRNNAESMAGNPATCNRGNQRKLYIAPSAGTWVPGLAANSNAVVKVTLIGADIRDISQLPGHPAGAGRHALASDLVLQGNISGSGPNAQAKSAIRAADVTPCPQ